MKLAALLILGAAAAIAQPLPSGVYNIRVDPAGSCSVISGLRYNYTNGKLWGCDSGTWTLVSGGGGSMTWPAAPGLTVCTGTPCTAWGTSLNLDGTTIINSANNIAANTSVLLTRPIEAQGIDTSCADTGSSTSSAAACAMIGNSAATWSVADQTPIRYRPAVTSAGGGLTLDIGNGIGALGVFQADCTTNPTATQWVNGQEIQLALKQGSPNKWCLYNTGGSSAPTPVSQVWTTPYGLIPNSSPDGTDVLSGANVTRFIEVSAPYPGAVVTNIEATTFANSGHFAFAIYDKDCNLLGQSTTYATAGGVPVAVNFPTPVSVPAGRAYIAYSADNTTLVFYAAFFDGNAYTVNTGVSSSSAHIFTGTATTGTTSLVFPSTCGTRATFPAPGDHWIPAILFN